MHSELSDYKLKSLIECFKLGAFCGSCMHPHNYNNIFGIGQCQLCFCYPSSPPYRSHFQPISNIKFIELVNQLKNHE